MTFGVIFAMSGGAYAASKSKIIITSTSQIKKSVLKELQGKNGSPGTPGPAGSTGAAGLPGKDGINGKDGTNGTDGVSVTSKELSTAEAGCKKEGGSEFEAAEGKKTTACNGSPWVAGGTLPAGKSEFGEFSYWNSKEGSASEKTIPISFGIPLKANAKAHFIGEHELAGEAKESAAIKSGLCKGNSAKPEAANGQLCAFTPGAFGIVGGKASFFDIQTGQEGAEAAGTLGTSLKFKTEAGEVILVGTWVVTGS
jgi:hypothetical protein